MFRREGMPARKTIPREPLNSTIAEKPKKKSPRRNSHKGPEAARRPRHPKTIESSERVPKMLYEIVGKVGKERRNLGGHEKKKRLPLKSFSREGEGRKKNRKGR